MPAKKMKRVKLTLAPEAKAFTSKGPYVSGSVIDLPVAEAQRLIDLNNAQLTDADVALIDPEVNCEATPPASEPDEA